MFALIGLKCELLPLVVCGKKDSTNKSTSWTKGQKREGKLLNRVVKSFVLHSNCELYILLHGNFI